MADQINAGYLTGAHPYPPRTTVHSSRHTHVSAVGGGPTSGSHSSVRYSQTVTVPLRIHSTVSGAHPANQEHHTSNVARGSTLTHSNTGSGHSQHSSREQYNIGHTVEIEHEPVEVHLNQEHHTQVPTSSTHTSRGYSDHTNSGHHQLGHYNYLQQSGHNVFGRYTL